MKSRRDRSVPRITIYADGRVTLSGLHYGDLRSILTQASLHNYDALRKPEASEDEKDYANESLALIQMAETAVMDAISASHHPVNRPRTGHRRPADHLLRDVPRGERLRRVRQDRRTREVIGEAIAALAAERQKAA